MSNLRKKTWRLDVLGDEQLAETVRGLCNSKILRIKSHCIYSGLVVSWGLDGRVLSCKRTRLPPTHYIGASLWRKHGAKN